MFSYLYSVWIKDLRSSIVTYGSLIMMCIWFRELTWWMGDDSSKSILPFQKRFIMTPR